MRRECTRDAQARYKKKLKQVVIYFNEDEQEAFKEALNKDNVSGYIKQLILEDLKK